MEHDLRSVHGDLRRGMVFWEGRSRGRSTTNPFRPRRPALLAEIAGKLLGLYSDARPRRDSSDIPVSLLHLGRIVQLRQRIDRLSDLADYLGYVAGVPGYDLRIDYVATSTLDY